MARDVTEVMPDLVNYCSESHWAVNINTNRRTVTRTTVYPDVTNGYPAHLIIEGTRGGIYLPHEETPKANIQCTPRTHPHETCTLEFNVDTLLPSDSTEI